MRRAIVWFGVIVVVVGVFLPWVTTSSMVGAGSANGLDMNAGPINIGIGIVGIVISFLAGRSNVSARLIGILLLIGGIAIVLMTINSVSDTSEARRALGSELFRPLAEGMRMNIQTAFGAYVTLAGGALLGLGGLAYLIGGQDH